MLTIFLIICVIITIGILISLLVQREQFAVSNPCKSSLRINKSRMIKRCMQFIWEANFCDPNQFEEKYNKSIDWYIRRRRTLRHWRRDVQKWAKRKSFQCGLENSIKIPASVYMENTFKYKIKVVLPSGSAGKKQLDMFTGDTGNTRFFPQDGSLKTPQWSWEANNRTYRWEGTYGPKTLRDLYAFADSMMSSFKGPQECVNNLIIGYLVKNFNMEQAECRLPPITIPKTGIYKNIIGNRGEVNNISVIVQLGDKTKETEIHVYYIDFLVAIFRRSGLGSYTGQYQGGPFKLSPDHNLKDTLTLSVEQRGFTISSSSGGTLKYTLI